MNVVASDSVRPSQEAFNSHALYRHIFALGVSGGTVRPGTRSKLTAKIRMPGITSPMTKSRPLDIFSCRTYGKEMDGSTGENGRWFGVMYQKPAPVPAMALTVVRRSREERLHQWLTQ